MAQGTLARPAPQLAVDEVGEPAEEQADRHGGRAGVEHAPGVGADAARKQHDGDDRADQAAVERHAALPHRGDVQRVAEVVARAHRRGRSRAARPAARRPSCRAGGRRPCRGANGALSLRPQAGLAQQAPDIEPAEQQAGHVGQPVPFDRRSARARARRGRSRGRGWRARLMWRDLVQQARPVKACQDARLGRLKRSTLQPP